VGIIAVFRILAYAVAVSLLECSFPIRLSIVILEEQVIYTDDHHTLTDAKVTFCPEDAIAVRIMPSNPLQTHR
jgi:hypothetical protein